jgi:hypothetical protein
MRQSAAAVGGLITALNRKQRDVRREFEECFRAFSSPKNSALFKRLFKAPGEGAEGP